jgi:hypothetical protein
VEKQKGQTFLEASQVITAAASIDPAAASLIDASEALRDTLAGIGVPTKWTRSREAVQAAAEAEAEQAQAQQLLSAMTQASGVVKNMGGVAA